MDDEWNPESTIDELITRSLGEELKKARENAGLSQAGLVERMPSGLHPKTLATYEQGVRQCTVVRLCEICRTLNVSVADMVGRALLHAAIDIPSIQLYIDIGKLAACPDGEGKIRRWAQRRLAAYPTTTMAKLTGDVIQELAIALQVDPLKLIDELARWSLAPGATTPSGQV